MKNQQGFTLIELVVVIVILGILAAVAVPKFVDMGSDARIAVTQSMSNTLRSSADMAYASALVKDVAPNATDFTLTDGTVVHLLNRYPRATALGIGRMIEDMGHFTTSGGGNGADSIIQFRHSKANNTATCHVAYQAANPAANRPRPLITLTTTGC